jgi:hypothetical protein
MIEPGRLLYALAAVVAVLGLALAVVTSALLSDNARHTAAGGAGSSSSASAPQASSSVPTPSTSPSGSVADQLDQTVTDALAANLIDGDTADKLREQINSLRDASEGRLRKQVQSFKRTIDGLTQDNKIDQATADQLNALLDSLGNNG